jgi:23S rRNA pseudouridine2457 synthase
MQIVLFNMPFGVVSQFTVPGSRSGPAAAEPPPTLKDFLSQRGIYPAGRLDADSEGLLVLTDDGVLQHRLTDPRHKLEKTYFAQVEGEPDAAALATLVRGVRFAEHVARATRARLVSEPEW